MTAGLRGVAGATASARRAVNRWPHRLIVGASAVCRFDLLVMAGSTVPARMG
jgi:hypothetical protein